MPGRNIPWNLTHVFELTTQGQKEREREGERERERERGRM